MTMKPRRLGPEWVPQEGGDLDRPSEYTSDSTTLSLIVLLEVKNFLVKVNLGE